MHQSVSPNKLLLEAGTDAASKSLMSMILTGQKQTCMQDMVQTMIAFGSDPNTGDNKGVTRPFITVVSYSHEAAFLFESLH